MDNKVRLKRCIITLPNRSMPYHMVLWPRFFEKEDIEDVAFWHPLETLCPEALPRYQVISQPLSFCTLHVIHRETYDVWLIGTVKGVKDRLYQMYLQQSYRVCFSLATVPEKLFKLDQFLTYLHDTKFFINVDVGYGKNLDIGRPYPKFDPPYPLFEIYRSFFEPLV